MTAYQIKRTTLEIQVADTETAGEQEAELFGFLRGVLVDAPDLDSTDTFTVSIEDANGFELFSVGTLAENTKHELLKDSDNFPIGVPLVGTHTVKITASGAQAADRDFSVYLLIEART